MKEKPSKKERQFCSYVARGYSEREAAALAGVNAQRLLDKRGVRERIEAAVNRSRRLQQAQAGFHRLAFGSIADAIRLLYLEEPTQEQIERLDLFNISEIKRSKSGVEIKFFDRQKALEQLAEGEQASEDAAEPFYKALCESARIYRGKGDDSEV